jgi:hypothetical protein
MVLSIKKIWKYSRLRFYVLNAMWNYKFWLFSKRLYKKISYQIEDGDYEENVYYGLEKKKKLVTKKRFVGYFFENNVYLDNPGLKIDDRETWENWKKKKLIK